MASFENRGDGVWRICVQLGLDANGKQRRIRRTVHLNSRHTLASQRAECEKIAAEIATDAGRGLLTAARAVTLQEIFTDYLDAREDLAPTTRAQYTFLWKRLQPVFGNCLVRDITPRMITAFLSNLRKASALTARSATGKLSGTTRRKYYTLLRTLLEYSVKMGYISVNPCAAVIPPAEDTPETRFYEPEQILTLLECLEQEPLLWRAFFVVGIYSGCRPGELVGADWNDICGSTLTIRAGAARVNGQTVRTQKPKTRASERKIDLPPVVLDILTMWHTEQMLHASAIGEPQPEAVFTQYDGRRIDLSSPTRRFQKIIKRYNLPPLTLYGLRHSAASLLISQGLDVRTVAARLGHSQTATTLNVYSHAFESANSRATQAITDAIEAARKNRKTDDLTPNSPQEE